MKVSVIIPTYNRAELLRFTLDAVIAQRSPAYEVIIVDDGSTDGTQDLLRGYLPYIQSLRIVNSGDLVARNVGLQAASGTHVAFCDSDDLWQPNMLSAMGELWEAELASGKSISARSRRSLEDGF